jgi:hypothetical protein
VPIERTLYLAGLGTFRDPALRQAALEYVFRGPLRPQETLVIPHATALNATGIEFGSGLWYSDETVHWMFDHFADLAAKMPPNFATRIMSLGGGCSEERLAALREYFADPSHQVQGGQYTLGRLADAIRECAGVHERESERVEHWLLTRGGEP